MIAGVLLHAAKESIDSGDWQTADEYLDLALESLKARDQDARNSRILDRVVAADADAEINLKWRALMAFAVGNGRGTRDHRQLLNILQTAPAHDPQASITSKKRADFYAWHTANKSQIAKLKKQIIESL